MIATALDWLTEDVRRTLAHIRSPDKEGNLRQVEVHKQRLRKPAKLANATAELSLVPYALVKYLNFQIRDSRFYVYFLLTFGVNDEGAEFQERGIDEILMQDAVLTRFMEQPELGPPMVREEFGEDTQRTTLGPIRFVAEGANGANLIEDTAPYSAGGLILTFELPMIQQPKGWGYA